MVYNFDSEQAGKFPGSWSKDRTGQGAMGTWVIQKDSSAPTQPNVLAQISQDETDYRFPVAVIHTSSLKDVVLSVKFKAVKGRVDQGAGLVFRYQDINNYYVVRANALEDTVNFYKVVDGRRREVVGSEARVSSGQWHTLKVEARGNTIQYYFGGIKFKATEDNTFTGPGKVGLWTKVDSYILFDDFTVKSLDKK